MKHTYIHTCLLCLKTNFIKSCLVVFCAWGLGSLWLKLFIISLYGLLLIFMLPSLNIATVKVLIMQYYTAQLWNELAAQEWSRVIKVRVREIKNLCSPATPYQLMSSKVKSEASHTMPRLREKEVAFLIWGIYLAEPQKEICLSFYFLSAKSFFSKSSPRCKRIKKVKANGAKMFQREMCHRLPQRAAEISQSLKLPQGQECKIKQSAHGEQALLRLAVNSLHIF